MSEFLEDFEVLLGMDDRPIVEFDATEWGHKVRLRGMTGNDRDAWEQKRANTDGSPNMVGMRADMVASCWVKADGSRVVPYGQETALGNRSAKGLDQVFQKCAELNGMTDDAVKKATENLSSDQSESSTSD